MSVALLGGLFVGQVSCGAHWWQAPAIASLVGMADQVYDLQLTRYDERGWRATFYTTGMEHLPTSATGTGGSTRRGTRRSGRLGGP
jgi:hypothetical protein